MAGSIKRLKHNDGRSDSEMYGESPAVDEKKRAAMDSHCEIERRRRNKMVSLVNELSDIVPACNLYDKRKPDKLTILKLAVDHLRALKNSNDVQDELGDNKSSFLSDSELKKLVLEATSGFLFVVICATGKVIYVSDTVSEVLGTTKADWDDVNLLSMVHPEDRSLLRKQLKVEDHELQQPCSASQDLSNDLCRRSFIIKMITSGPQREREVVVTDGGKKYIVVHVTGYIRHWPNATDYCHQPQLSSQSCLIAIGHCKQRFVCDESEASSSPITSFVARHNASGMFTFVDSRVCEILGHKTVDLLHRSIFDFCHESDRYILKEAFQQVIEKKDQVVNITIRIFNSSGSFTSMRLSCSAFLNPFSEAVEYISATYTVFAQACNPTIFKDLDLKAMHGKCSTALAMNNVVPLKGVIPKCTSYSISFSSNTETNTASCNHQNQMGQHVLSRDGHVEQPHVFNVTSTQNSFHTFDSHDNWVNHQAERKKSERNSNIAPPDYHQHMNMFPLVQEPDSYHAGNQAVYDWPAGSHGTLNEMSEGANSQRFVDASNFVRTSNIGPAPWSSYDASGLSDFPYGYIWQNDHPMLISAHSNNADDMNEVMHMLATSSSSTSAMFGAMDENIIKKFCS